MFKNLLTGAILLTGSFCCAHQNDSLKTKHKGTFYAGWGYNLDWYSKSDIHISNNGDLNEHNYKGNYDFTVHDAQARDRADFEGIGDLINITIPQYVWRIGYMFNDKRDLGIELSYDHAKYIVNDYQKLRVTGQIFGQPLDKDTIIDPKTFLHFEHTDGANFVTPNLVKRFKLYQAKSKLLKVSCIGKYGFGIVFPRTDVTLFGKRINNRFHVAGYFTGVELGPRIEIYKYFYAEWTIKGGYANYTNSLVIKDTGKAKHNFTTFMTIWSVGFMFPL